MKTAPPGSDIDMPQPLFLATAQESYIRLSLYLLVPFLIGYFIKRSTDGYNIGDTVRDFFGPNEQGALDDFLRMMGYWLVTVFAIGLLAFVL
jgi:hypothetical protein